MGRKKIYTEEELKERIKEQQKEYYQSNKERIKEKQKKWRENNKERIKERRKEYKKKWRENNKERIKEQRKKWIENNKERIKEYTKTPKGRARYLLDQYKISDKKYNRGECTLTNEWIVKNIFSSRCIYCGESDWRKLGCDRKDNSLPHIPDNCVPCCGSCNTKKGTKNYDEYMKQINQNKK